MTEREARTKLTDLSLDLSASELRLVTGGGWKKFTKKAKKTANKAIKDTGDGMSKMVEETGAFFDGAAKTTNEVVIEEIGEGFDWYAGTWK